MAKSGQELLKEAWLGGSEGHLSAMMQARAWALREIWKDDKNTQYGMLTYIAGKLRKVGKSGKPGGRPTPQALGQFFATVDADSGWYPGKSTQASFGPSRAITPTNEVVVARSAMAMSERGEEVTYTMLLANNPNALQNSETKEPVGKKAVYRILRERCHDDPNNPEDTWDFRERGSSKALTDGEIEKRLVWARHMKGLRWQAWWIYKWVVWTDICNSLLPRSEKRHNQMILSRKGGKGWLSKGSKLKSKALKGKPEARKQKGYDAVRVYWAPILTRGKLHIELLGEGFPGETAEGAAILVAKVRAALNIRFQAAGDVPNTLFVDRGQGFFHIQGGRITDQYKAALREHRLKSHCGDDGSLQPGSCQEMMLHETSVSWIRHREKKTLPRQPWNETVADFRTRLKGICEHINANHDVEGLCREFPERLQMLIDAEGDRIRK